MKIKSDNPIINSGWLNRHLIVSFQKYWTAENTFRLKMTCEVVQYLNCEYVGIEMCMTYKYVVNLPKNISMCTTLDSDKHVQNDNLGFAAAEYLH